MSLLAFVLDRVNKGHMEPQAIGRMNRALRGVDADTRLDLAMRGMSFYQPPPGLPLTAEPVSWEVATTMTNIVHRHHSCPVGHLFSFGVFAGDDLVGVGICGRPVARMLDDGKTMEITRIASIGYRNSISKLLGAIKREAKGKGYQKLITYTLAGESGSSMKAAGFSNAGQAGGGSWSRQNRLRGDMHPTERKTRWECHLC